MKQRGDNSGCSATCVFKNGCGLLQPNVCSRSLHPLQASVCHWSTWTQLGATNNGPGWRSGDGDKTHRKWDFRRTGHWVGWVWKVSEEIALSPRGFSLHNHPSLTMPPGCETLVVENKTCRNSLPQVFALHSPNHKCLPGNQLPTHHEMNLSKEEWNEISVKTSCMFKGFTREQLRKIKTIVRQNPSSDRLQGVYDIQVV